jgi:urocanate hydratase
MVLARNTISGNIADVSPKMLQHPQFKDILEVVDADAKPYIPEMYAPGTKSEKASKRDKKRETVEAIAEDVVEEIETITNTEEEN